MSTPKTVLITGCSDGGIGSALAVSFQRRGHRVLAGVRDPSRASELTSLPNVTILVLDVTSADSIQATLTATEEHTAGRGLDVLVNNAGFATRGPLAEADLAAGRALFETNFWGLLAMVQAFAPLLVRARGTIVNISSLGGMVPVPYLGLYCASKAAVTLASDTMRVEMKPLGVSVVTLLLGLVGTRFGTHIRSVTLPTNSPYKPVEDAINAMPTQFNESEAKKLMRPQVLADQLVDSLLRGRSGRLWMGGTALLARILNTLLPTWAMELSLSRYTGFGSIPAKKTD